MLSSSFKSNYLSNIFRGEKDLILSKNYKYNNLIIKRHIPLAFDDKNHLSIQILIDDVLYLIYALFSGLVGTAFSVLIRLEFVRTWCSVYC